MSRGAERPNGRAGRLEAFHGPRRASGRWGMRSTVARMITRVRWLQSDARRCMTETRSGGAVVVGLNLSDFCWGVSGSRLCRVGVTHPGKTSTSGNDGVRVSLNDFPTTQSTT